MVKNSSALCVGAVRLAHPLLSSATSVLVRHSSSRPGRFAANWLPSKLYKLIGQPFDIVD